MLIRILALDVQHQGLSVRQTIQEIRLVAPPHAIPETEDPKAEMIVPGNSRIANAVPLATAVYWICLMLP